ncbi:hypothetical protein pb186bvf_016787 [Paramecium bursaria]
MALPFLYQVLSQQIEEKEKTIYLTEGENYQHPSFQEMIETTYSFVDQSKGFEIDQSNLKLRSDSGGYLINPTKILRERQLINIGDYQGQGQFGILDQFDTGHRICYNSNISLILDQCIELDDTAISYDFVFIDQDTIAVSKIRVDDQQFSVSIYKNKQIVSELNFVPSKTYEQTTQSIIELCQFNQIQYLLFGLKDQDTNIEFIQIQPDFQLINTNKFIDKSIMPVQESLYVLDIKGTINKVIIAQEESTKFFIVPLTYKQEWNRGQYKSSNNFRALEIGYINFPSQLTQSIFVGDKDLLQIFNYGNGDGFYNLQYDRAKLNAQIKFTLNYIIILQDNVLIVIQGVAQKKNAIDGIILKIDVDFQNDIVFVFTDTKILSYYLKPITLSYKATSLTQSLELVTVKATIGDYQQFAYIHFQTLAKDNYNFYLLKPFTNHLYYNCSQYYPIYKIPINVISGPDIRVDAKVDEQFEIIAYYTSSFKINTNDQIKNKIIQEQLLTFYFNPFLFRQFDDFSFISYDCIQQTDSYNCSSKFTYRNLKQKVTAYSSQKKLNTNIAQFAMLTQDGMYILISYNNQVYRTLQAESNDKFYKIVVGIDRLFVITQLNKIQIYSLPEGTLIYQKSHQSTSYNEDKANKNVWVNQAVSNLFIYGFEDNIYIGRLTSEFILIQMINMKSLIDLAIISDQKIIILNQDKTLIQYELQFGVFQQTKVIQTYGFNITGNNIYMDHVHAKIMVEAYKQQQKVLLVIGVTELERDSLLKVIPLSEDEFLINAISDNDVSCLLKGTKDMKKKTTIVQLNYEYQQIEFKLKQNPSIFNQRLELMYTFSNFFLSNMQSVAQYLYLENQFFNLTIKQDSNNKIQYKDETQLIIPIEQDAFQGQVRHLFLASDNENVKLTTRIKYDQYLEGITIFSDCKQLIRFKRIICILQYDVTYHELSGKRIFSLNLLKLATGNYRQFIIHYDEKYAIVLTSNELILVYIQQDELQTSQQGWFVHVQKYYIKFYQFTPDANDQWLKQTIYYFDQYDIEGIQYDPQTKYVFFFKNYIFYQKDNELLSYFYCSLEDDTILDIKVSQINIVELLQSQNIYQVGTEIQNIFLKTIEQNSFLLISTSFGNILNVTMIDQKFKINSLYITYGKSNVMDIQIIDDWVLMQIQDYCYLYKNSKNSSLDIPYLTLEGIRASRILGLYKNDEQIVYFIYYHSNYSQKTIDDDIYITINNLTEFGKGLVEIIADNDINQTSIKYQIYSLEDESEQKFIYKIVHKTFRFGYFLVLEFQYYYQPQVSIVIRETSQLNKIQPTHYLHRRLGNQSYPYKILYILN